MEVLIICAIPIGIVILIAYLSSNAATQRKKEKDEATAAYYESLERLKADPSNPNLRQVTLELGRIYSNLTRDRRGVTIFDEVALSNDIGAASAGATGTSPGASNSSVTRSSVQERLEKLEDFRRQSIISDDEYATRRAQIIAEI